MLKLTSRFVLQVLPYLFMALAAVVLLPGIAELLIAGASSPPREKEMMTEPFGLGETTLDPIHEDTKRLHRTGSYVNSLKPPKPILRIANARSCA